MRTLAIGDIHGCLTALDLLLARVEVRPDDRLIALGDYVDRGPDSRGVLDRVIKLHETGQLIALRGNHDAMMQVVHTRNAANQFFADVQTWLARQSRPGRNRTATSTGDSLRVRQRDIVPNTLSEPLTAMANFTVGCGHDDGRILAFPS